MKLCLLLLTCANDAEATKISSTLLSKKLIFCSKRCSVSSSFLWKGKEDSSDEVLMIMDSIEQNFQEIEKEVRKIHSYETFVLLSVPVSRTTNTVEEWVRNEIVG